MSVHQGHIPRMSVSRRTEFFVSVEVAPSTIVGQGLFARQDIKAGDRVMRWGGYRVPRSVILRGAARLNSVVELDSGDFLVDLKADSPQPDEFLNHSCDPNLAMLSDIDLIAFRDIAAGEELFLDYAMYRSIDWVVNPRHVMPCSCGAVNCRKEIRADDHLTHPELRIVYRNLLAPYLLREIDALVPT